ncbi:hypothetical protein NL533_31165, partial [Klebsiella pneumoniae]|nr:hypothetical protein [Klebsiella pneumoniae]
DETKSVLTKRSSNERLSIENIKKIDSDGDFGDELKVGAVQDVESKIAETGAFTKENKLENNENYTPTIPKCVYRSASEVKMKEDESPKVI